jgi:hypothetical protein
MRQGQLVPNLLSEDEPNGVNYIAKLPLEVLVTSFGYLDKVTLLKLLITSKYTSKAAKDLLYMKAYEERIHERIGLEQVLKIRMNRTIWSRICLVALACLYQLEWSLGAPRLFFLNDDNDLHTIQKYQSKYPNPTSKEWKEIIHCTMDYTEFIAEHSKDLIKSNSMIQKYSERMDIGTFLFYCKLPIGAILFRCKPIGNSSRIEPDGKLVIWDDAVFGICSVCKLKLERLQVCADCRILQYCSKECQKLDWENGHKSICRSLALQVQHSP